MARSIQLRLALCVVTLGVMSACDESPTGLAADPDVEVFVSLVNDHRVAIGCEPLTWISEIADVAQAHSEDMAQRDYFDHTSPDGKSPFDRMRDAGLTLSRAAENIAYGYATPHSVLEGWLNSPGHRANIENCSLVEHGVGLHASRWTHLFRAP